MVRRRVELGERPADRSLHRLGPLVLEDAPTRKRSIVQSFQERVSGLRSSYADPPTHTCRSRRNASERPRQVEKYERIGARPKPPAPHFNAIARCGIPEVGADTPRDTIRKHSSRLSAKS